MRKAFQEERVKLKRKKKGPAMKTLKITLVRSVIGTPEKHRRIIRSLGLRKIRQSVLHKDTPTIRGQIHKTSHLIEVKEEAEG
ncbi:MAG: 50S ribosomal protein L30 [Nitrospirae bacterium]|nr:50S ribosomal protein L30 [Nitrospirota bacterium]